MCPFARAARLKRTIRFEVRHFDLDDTLDPDGEIMTLVREFAEDATAGIARPYSSFTRIRDRVFPLCWRSLRD